MRANISNGVPPNIGGRLKESATSEASMLSYLFTDAVAFVSKCLQIYLDERSTRENITQFFQLLNTICPFLLMNDYRVAKQTMALQRSDCLEQIIKKLT